MSNIFTTHRLGQGPGGSGLTCEAGGVALAGAPLLRRSGAGGLEPRSLLEIDVLAKAAWGEGVDAAALRRGLGAAARALNDGDVGRAQVAALHLRLPALDDGGAGRVTAVEGVLAKLASFETPAARDPQDDAVGG